MPQFTRETVAPAAAQSSLAVDRQGNPYIAYVSGDGTLMLASRHAGAWTLEALSGAPPIERSSRDRIWVKIDSAGNPHVAYAESNTRHLIYGVRRGRWEFVPVPTRLLRRDPGGVAEYAFDLYARTNPQELRDTPHFVFYDSSTAQLGYANRIAGRFVLVNAAPADGVTSTNGLFPSIGFDDSSASFLVAYIELFGRREDPDDPLPLTKLWLKAISSPLEGALDEPTLVEQGRFSVVTPTSITVNGRFCLASANATTRALNAWVREEGIVTPVKHEVATTAAAVVPCAAQTSNGAFRIVYGDGNRISLASQNRFGEWTVEVVNEHGRGMPSLAYDRFSTGHLAYSTNDGVEYATWIEQ